MRANKQCSSYLKLEEIPVKKTDPMTSQKNTIIIGLLTQHTHPLFFSKNMEVSGSPNQ
jgi:hypothetical protein